MRKLIILICVILIGYSVYALSPGLFPDTAKYPRLPTAEGTVGGILEKILEKTISDASQDGTVKNSTKLDGVTATGYLKNTDCVSLGQKWIGIDATGKAVCGTSTPILADYGTVSEQGCAANIYHATGTNGTTNTGDTLKSGDIIKTGACGLTIAFADYSILRLDADTTVSLDILAAPAPSTQTIASAILSNGSLWGRILTDTGSYSIGTDKIVAGVRGTSIAVSSTGNTVAINPASPAWTINTTLGSTDTEVAIVDSTNMTPDNPSATVYCRDPNSLAQILSPMSPENTYRIPPTGCTNTPAISPDTAPTLYSRSPWIRRNTQKDLSYMYRLMALSGSSISSGSIAKITNEITQTQPPTNPTDPETLNLCEYPQTWWNTRYGCQGSNVLAQADYTLPEISQSGPLTGVVPSLYIRSGSTVVPALIKPGSGPTPIASPTNGLYNPIAYDNLGSILSGDWTMEIEVEGSLLLRSGGSFILAWLNDPSGSQRTRIFINGSKLYVRSPTDTQYITGFSTAGYKKVIIQKTGSSYTVGIDTMRSLPIIGASSIQNLYLGIDDQGTALTSWQSFIRNITIKN